MVAFLADGWAISQVALVVACTIWGLTLWLHFYEREVTYTITGFLAFLCLVFARSEAAYYFPDASPGLRFGACIGVAALFGTAVTCWAKQALSAVATVGFASAVAIGVSPGLPMILAGSLTLVILIVLICIGSYLKFAAIQAALSFLYTFSVIYTATYCVRFLSNGGGTDILTDFNSDLERGMTCFAEAECASRVVSVVLLTVARIVIVMYYYVQWRRTEGYQPLQTSAPVPPPHPPPVDHTVVNIPEKKA